jgi:hypothetical protein
MKIRKISSLTGLLLAVGLLRAPAPVNIVGYINRSMTPGYNLITDQLFQIPDNTLNSVLTNGVPANCFLLKWSGGAWLPPSLFSAGAWSINYTLNPGEGAALWTPAGFTATFVGNVPDYQPIGTQIWSPNYSPGLHLISGVLPLGLPISSNFTNAVGRLPVAGESVWFLDELTQLYSQSTFNGVTWSSDLVLAVGQAAWFDIGGTGQLPPMVPEPTASVLIVLGALVLVARPARRR